MVLAAMMVLAAGCQKEETTQTTSVNAVRSVEYMIDNSRQHVTVTGDAEWQKLLGECLDSAAAGHLINIAHGTGANYAKERQVYSTESRDAALAWVDARFNEGYDVTMWYDEEEGKYICVASKLAPPTGDDSTGYMHVPLNQYLLGGWRTCTDYNVVFTPNAGWAQLENSEQGLLCLTDALVHDIYMLERGTNNNPYQTWNVSSNNTLTIDGIPGRSTISSQYSVTSPFRITVDDGPYFLGYLLYEWSQDTMMAFKLTMYHPNEPVLEEIYPMLFVRER